jgi:hypothetical protein
LKKCPKCRSKDVHRSRTKSRWESWRKAIMGKRPFRCRACGWRGWAHDHQPDFTELEMSRAERAVATGAAVARGQDGRLDVNLDVLDVVDAPEQTPAPKDRT